MPQIGTGQLDLGELKEFFLRKDPDSLSGSISNITGFYPYGENPSGYASSGYVDTVSGHISGYIDSVSGALRTDLLKTGLDLSGYTVSITNNLKSDINEVSGDLVSLTASHDTTYIIATGNRNDIDTISGGLHASGQDLMLLITGESGQGVSGFVTGFVHDTSGVLDSKISSLDSSLKAHVSEDFLSKKDTAQTVSGSSTFLKNLVLEKGAEYAKVNNKDLVSTSQTGVTMYSHVEAQNIGPDSFYHEVLTTFLRHPQSGDNTRQDLIVSTFQYSGGIPE